MLLPSHLSEHRLLELAPWNAMLAAPVAEVSQGQSLHLSE